MYLWMPIVSFAAFTQQKPIVLLAAAVINNSNGPIVLLLQNHRWCFNVVQHTKMRAT